MTPPVSGALRLAESGRPAEPAALRGRPSLRRQACSRGPRPLEAAAPAAPPSRFRGYPRAGCAARAALCALCCLASSAWADVWGYIDPKGVAHFATERVDERYELFYKGQDSFDTREGVGAINPPPAPPAPPPVDDRPAPPPKLLAFFDMSPSYKLVKNHLREASATHRIDYELLQALIVAESGFDSTAVSPKGAIGLMQIMPATAERYGLAGDAKTPLERKLTDPKINIRIGARYLRDLINMFPGQLDLALASYNAGEGAVQKAGNRIPNFKETQNYVKTVLQLYNGLKPLAPPPPVIQIERRRQQPARVRMELPGGALGRGNMPAEIGRSGPSAAPQAPQP